jgi:two-component system LytT family response regulator
VAADQLQLSLPLIGEHVMVRPSDIVWLEARGSYTNLVFKDGNHLLIGKRIGEFEKKLNGMGFIRCHQTHIINWRYITRVVSSLGIMEIVLFSGQRVTVSRRYQKEVKEALKNM